MTRREKMVLEEEVPKGDDDVLVGFGSFCQKRSKLKRMRSASNWWLGAE